jgi:hypothetical protein
MLDELVVADTEEVRGGGLNRRSGRRDAGIVASVGAGHDRAQGDKVSFNQYADVLVHLEAKIRERLAEL